MNRTLNFKKFITNKYFSFWDIFLRGGDFRDEGASIILSPGKSILHLAELESPGEETFPPEGDSIKGRFRFWSPAESKTCHFQPATKRHASY